MGDPTRVLVAGDWHGNTDHAVGVIEQLPDLLPDEDPLIVLHAGDFGIWPGRGGQDFVDDVAQALLEADAFLWFVDGNHECLDAVTRAVTRRGFVEVDELRGDDEVLSVDDDGNRMWLPIDAVVRRQHDGVLHRLTSRSIDMAVTPGHRVVGKSIRDDQKWVEYRGDDLSGRRLRVVVAAHNPSPDEATISDDMLRLYAWCLTDAHHRADGGWHFFQRESAASRITGLIERLGFKYSASTRTRGTTHIRGKKLKNTEPEVTVRLGVGVGRELPWDKTSLAPFVWRLSRRQVEVFVEELIHCDGSRPKNPNSRAAVLYCIPPAMRDQLHLLLLTNGYRVTQSTFRGDDHRLNLCDRTTVEVVTSGPRACTTVGTEHYTGSVWCLQVVNGRFFAERNGKTFLTGNCHDRIDDAFAGASYDRTHRVPDWESWGVPQRIAWLPRGHRWSWHDRTWLALGGAVSVDHRARVPGRSWWPGETLTDEDVQAATGPGRADVVLAHDCPSSVSLNLPRPAPAWWDLRTADAHRDVVQRVADAVRPSWWIHGHYHLAHQTTVAMGHGDVEVTGLDCDGATHGAHRVLDVRTMTWET